MFPDFYAGLLLHYKNVNIVETEKNKQLIKEDITGVHGGQETASGVTLLYDNRDSLFYPLSGFLIKFSSMYTMPWSDYNFSFTEFEASYFHAIYKTHVIAFQLSTELSSGNVPFYSLPAIGGSSLMRGLMQNRFIDKTAIAGQVEYRYPIWWRFAGTMFAANGQVQEKLSDYNISDTKLTGGLGLRVILDREKYISARLDVGFNTKGQPAVYLLAKEAF